MSFHLYSDFISAPVKQTVDTEKKKDEDLHRKAKEEDAERQKAQKCTAGLTAPARRISIGQKYLIQTSKEYFEVSSLRKINFCNYLTVLKGLLIIIYLCYFREKTIHIFSA